MLFFHIREFRQDAARFKNASQILESLDHVGGAQTVEIRREIAIGFHPALGVQFGEILRQ